MLGACRRSPEIPPAPHTAVRVAAIGSAEARPGTRYAAHVEPAVRVDLAFKVGGYVDAVTKVPGVDGKGRALQEGDAVRQGQVLASLRATDYALRAQEARAGRDQAKTALDQAQRDLDRIEKLVATGAATQVDLEALRARRDAARNSLTGADTLVAEASTVLGDATLRAPIDGIVLKRWIEAGGLAGPGTLAFSVADVASVKVVFAVPDSVLPRLRLGATQAVTADAWPGVTFTGRVSRISPAADPRSLAFEAEVSIPNDDGRLKPGMLAALAVADDASGPNERAPLVPLPAIVRAPGGAQPFGVFVVEGAAGAETVRLRPIELGEYLGRVVPVKRGLAAGERVVVLGAGLLADGERVEVIP
jgi:multidrug efflux system membrane fusion protein